MLVLEWSLTLLLGATVACVFIQVVSRHLLAVPLQGLEEIARLCFVWGCCLGIGYCAMRNEHIAMDAIVRRVSPRTARWFSLACGIAVQFVAFAMLVCGAQLVVRIWAFPDYSTALLYPRALFWLPVPLCGAILFAAGLRQAFGSASQLADSRSDEASQGKGGR